MEKNREIVVEFVGGQGFICEAEDRQHEVAADFLIEEIREGSYADYPAYVCMRHLGEVLLNYILEDESRS